MIIGITGTEEGGKGEVVWETAARPCQLFCELVKQKSDKVYRAGTAPVPGVGIAAN